VMAIAGMFSMVLALLSDVGLRQTALQSPRGEERAFLDTVWTMQVLRGTCIWLGCLMIALGIGLAGLWGWLPTETAYSSPILPWVVAVSGLSAIVSGLQSTRAVEANRRLDVKRVMLAELIAQLFGLMLMAALGWWTRSIWALVAGSLAVASASSVLSHTWLPGERNRLRWDRTTVGELLGKGRWFAMSSTTYILSTTADRMLLAGWATAASLGLYGLALQMSSLVENACSRLFAIVAMPALSELARSDRERFRTVFFKMRMPFDALFVGAAGFLFAGGQAVVDLLYDPRYADAGWMLQVLSFKLLFARYSLCTTAYLALGAPRDQALINATKLGSVVVLIPVLASLYGLEGAVWAIALHLAPTLPLVFRFNERYGLNSLRIELLSLLCWPLGYGAGLAFELLLRRWVLT
jgi:O-antigen/teichoic acid export membrane protein